MGAFSVKIEIGPMDGARYAEVDALVDTGANTTVMPASTLRGLGIEPAISQMFEYADGNRVELDMGNASVKIEGRETITWVIFGERRDGSPAGRVHADGRVYEGGPGQPPSGAGPLFDHLNSRRAQREGAARIWELSA